jgi:hypothetical protein
MSTVPAQLEPPALARRVPPSRRALAAAALLSVVLGCALATGLSRERSSLPPASSAAHFAHDGLLSLPAAARGPVSAALGADDPAYRVGISTGGFVAVNPAQGLESRFSAAGVSFSSGATEVRLSLRALGYGSSLIALDQPAPRASDNRVLYSRSGLQESYANGPLGLEQRFTLARPPAGRPLGPLTLSMALSGSAHASLGRGEQSITFSHGGAPVLRYGGLSATDARGHALRAWLALSAGRALLRVDARNARYPLRIDPLVHQGEKLTVSGLTGPYGYVGQSVALSADGNTALIGAPADDEYTGAAWVFTRSGSTWTQQGEKLTGSGTVGESWFGESVALSADGSTAVIGGPSDDGAVGAAWVFTRSGSTWTQQGGKLTGGEEDGEGYFGRSVALAGDTAMIGGYNDNEHRGAVWVFTRSGATWTQQGAKLTGGGGLGFFGWSVALSDDGDTGLIGEWGLNDGVGAAWVFTRSGSTWSKQGGALAAGASGETWFGYSVALSGDGDTALVGAPHGNSYAGAAWVFTRSGSTWTQQGEGLSGGDEVGEGELGYGAALSDNGNAALLGGRVDDGFHGAAWAFGRSGSTWTQQGEKLSGSGESTNREEFGWSVALSSAADTAVVGSPCDKACVGSASVFVNGPPEYGRCLKVAKGAGRYSKSSCTAPGGKREYDWEAGVQNAAFTTHARSAALETVKKSKVTCTAETSAGEYTGRQTMAAIVLTFTGCERSSQKCSSAGAGAGEIVSSPLDGMLGLTGGPSKVGLDLFPALNGGPVMAFACGASSLSVRGSVVAPLKADRMSSAQALGFKASKGRQKPESLAGAPKDVLEESFDGAPFEQAGLSMAMILNSGEGVEVNSVA